MNLHEAHKARTDGMKVLVINDFIRKGGAEEVYRMSLDVLRQLPGVEVESFDASTHASAGGMVESWGMISNPPHCIASVSMPRTSG